MNQRGFTILELLIALGIFSIVSSAMAPAFIGYLKFNTASEIRSEASSAAQQTLDELRVFDPATMPSSGSDPVLALTVGLRQYDVTVSYCVNATYCTAASRHIQVEVAYSGKTVYQVETVYTQLK